MILPVGQAILAQAAGPQRMGRVMSVIGVPTLLGPILGPVIGGVIVDNFSWRWIFFVNIPVGMVALALAARTLPRAELRGARPALDVTGLALLSPGLVLLVYGLSEYGHARQPRGDGGAGARRRRAPDRAVPVARGARGGGRADRPAAVP